MALYNKATFVAQMQLQVTLLAQANEQLQKLVSTYFDATFNSGGAQQIVDADVAANQILAADVAAGVTFAQQLALLLAGSAPATATYHVTISKLRTDV